MTKRCFWLVDEQICSKANQQLQWTPLEHELNPSLLWSIQSILIRIKTHIRGGR